MKAIDVLKYFLGPWFCLTIILAFVTEKPVSGYGDEFRIFYFHVPLALVAFLAFLISLIYSIRYLKYKQASDDLKAASSAELGLVFGILATLTGSIFARIAWGAFWNWDIRQTSILVLLAVYGAYFALRGAVEPEDRRATFSAVYAILAFAAVPIFGLIIPRMYQSLHPSDALISGGGLALGTTVAVVFFCSMIAFVLLYIWLFNLKWRMVLLERSQLEKDYE